MASPEPTKRPAELLNDRLRTGPGRAVVIITIVVIWVLDALLSRRLIDSGAVTGGAADVVRIFETASTLIFIPISIGLMVTFLRGYHRMLWTLSSIYLGFAVLQVAANVLGLIVAAGQRSDAGLAGLWDVAATYAMSATVFMFVYAVLDVHTRGGAFVWPARDGEEPPVPNLIDYAFISLNTNATFGPTSESVISRTAKVVMIVQVLLAVLMLTVLISRAVAATS